jgi:Uma2 family endonuclease
MSAIPKRAEYSIEDLLALPDDGKSYELIDGELVEKNASNLSSLVGGNVLRRLGTHCEAKDLGPVFNSEAIYRCFRGKPRTGRKPDVSFIKKENLPETWEEDGFFEIAPDLAVEVTSPNDLLFDVDRKISEYLEADVKLVWEINPHLRFARIHRADGTVTRLLEKDILSGENVVKGFKCRLGDLFPPAKPGAKKRARR